MTPGRAVAVRSVPPANWCRRARPWAEAEPPCRRLGAVLPVLLWLPRAVALLTPPQCVPGYMREGQNPRMGPVRRHRRGSPGPTSFLKQGHPGACGTGLRPDRSGVSPLRQIPKPVCAIRSHVQFLLMFFLMFRGNSLCITFCPLSLSCHLASPR